MKLRRKGANSNFIHGGASLQELAIPVIQVQTLRKETVHAARVSVLGSHDITTASVTLKLLQEEPVGGSVLAHHLRLWFETEDGTRILSNRVECVCDSRDEALQNRSFPITFEFLPEAHSFKGNKIILRLNSVVEGGTLVTYESIEFRLKQIAYDFDQF